ncbi:MAG: DUF2141 domain-containing protein, partial [Ignavibacterium sp.]
FAVAQSLKDVDTGTLTVIIIGLENDDGEVLLALSNSRENYESDSESYRGFKVKIENGKAECTIDELPYGEYAIKLYHDENLDGELNSNFLGIPTEDYGFSNNASGTFGPADYDDAKFLIDHTNVTINISVN